MAKHDASDTARKGGKSPEASMLRIGTGCGRMGGGHSVWPVPDGGGATGKRPDHTDRRFCGGECSVNLVHMEEVASMVEKSLWICKLLS